MDTIDYVKESITPAESWPDWDSMKKSEFKVIFRLPRPMPSLRANEEYDVKFYGSSWYFKIPGMYFTPLMFVLPKSEFFPGDQ